LLIFISGKSKFFFSLACKPLKYHHITY
jgi:hypothetical protein